VSSEKLPRKNCGFSSLGLSRAGHRLPVVGKQFAQPGDGLLRNAREHILEPGKRLDATPLAGTDEASQHRGRLASSVASEEGPIAPAQRDIAVGPFRGAVIDLQLAVFEKALTPPTDPAHSAPRRRMDSSAEPPAAALADTGGACRAAVPISAGAMPEIPLRCCVAIRSAHSSAFGLAGFCSMTVSLITQQCSADRYIGKSGLRDAYVISILMAVYFWRRRDEVEAVSLGSGRVTSVVT